MKDEIKEILYLEKYIDKYKSDEKSIINGNRLTTPAMLDYLEVKDLLDYITNLQEENENRISESLSYDLAKAKIKELDKENKCEELEKQVRHLEAKVEGLKEIIKELKNVKKKS